MKVEFLPSTSYLGIEVQNPQEIGISEGSHIAAIEFPGDKRPTRSYVKFCGPEEFCLFYEILGYTLAHYLQLKQPDRAAVVIVPIQKLLDVGAGLPEWIPEGTEYMPAFCTVEAPVRSIRYIYNTDDLLRSKYAEIFKKCGSWYACVAAFDEWLANNDRNGGNILMLSDSVYSIIDHGRLFDNKHPNVKRHTKDLISQNLMKLVIEEKGAERDIDVLKNGMTIASHKHSSATKNSEAEIKQWIERFQSIDEEVVLRFIKDRCEGNWMEDRVGVI